MQSLMDFLRRLVRTETQTPVLEMLDIPNDVPQAAIVAMQALGKNKFEDTFLAYLSPECVRTSEGPGRRYFLEAENLNPQHVLECWIWRGGHWHPCEVADFLAQRGKQGVGWQEFALRFTGTQVIIVWQWLHQVIRERRGGTGGTVVLVQAPSGWVESDEQGEGWMI